MNIPFDETDAPPGYRAVAVGFAESQCPGCAFSARGLIRCSNPYRGPDGPKHDLGNPFRFRCPGVGRRDRTPARFVPALYGNEEDP